MEADCVTMLRLLVEWQMLPPAERDRYLGLTACAAEDHFRGLQDAEASYDCWLAAVCDRSPAPVPFVARGTA